MPSAAPCRQPGRLEKTSRLQIKELPSTDADGFPKLGEGAVWECMMIMTMSVLLGYFQEAV